MSERATELPPRPSAPSGGRRPTSLSSSFKSSDLSGSLDLGESAAPAKPAAAPAAAGAPKRGPTPDPAASLPSSDEDESVHERSNSIISYTSAISKKSSSSNKGKPSTSPVKAKEEEAEDPDISFSSQTTLSAKPEATPAPAPAPAKPAAATSKVVDDDDDDDKESLVSEASTAMSKKSSRSKTSSSSKKPETKVAAADKASKDSEEDADISFSTETSLAKPAAAAAAAPAAAKPAPTPAKPASKASDEDDDDNESLASAASTAVSKKSSASKRSTAAKEKPKPTPKAPPTDDGNDDAGSDISFTTQTSTPAKAAPVPPTAKPAAASKNAPAAAAADDDDDDDDDDVKSTTSKASSAVTSASKHSKASTANTAVSKKSKPPAPKSKAAPSVAEVDEGESGELDLSVSAGSSVSRAASMKPAAAAAAAAVSLSSSQAAPEDEDVDSEDEDKASEKSGSGSGGYSEEEFEDEEELAKKSVAATSRSISLKGKASSKASSFKSESVADDKSQGGASVAASKKPPVVAAPAKSLRDDDDDDIPDDPDEDDDEETPLKPIPVARASANRPTSARPGARPPSGQSARRPASGSETPRSRMSEDRSELGSEDQGSVAGRSRAGSQAPATPPRPSKDSQWRPSSATSKLAGGDRRVSASQDSWEGEVRTPPRPGAAPPRSARPQSGHSEVSDSEPAGRRQRPASAAPRMRQGQQVTDLARRHPTTWDVRDVCMWVESIGLGQYRKKFVHNIVDGRILLMLTDDQIKQELSIAPIGHRIALLRAIDTLLEDHEATQQQASPSSAWGATKSRDRPSSARPPSAARTRPSQPEYPRRPASASHAVIPPDMFLGPASGKMTVYEQRSKLLFELDRAAARAAQHKAIADQLLHTANMSEEEVMKLRGLLQDLEHKNRLQVQNASGGLDSNSRIPWRPVGEGTKVLDPYPERTARPGEDPGLDMTFKPRLSKGTRTMFREAGSQQSTFLDRLENDLRKRDRSKKDLDRKYYSSEALFQDPMLAHKMHVRDVQFLKDYTAHKGLIDGQLSDNEQEMDMQLDEMVNNYADTWKLKEKQVNAILAVTGKKKVKAVVTAVRAMLFMQRYESELRQRDDKLVSLQKKWWEMSMGKPGRKDEEDRTQMVEYFGLLGWRGDGEEAITDSRLRALLMRAREYKKELEAWKERNRDKPSSVAGEPVININWDAPPWTVDGLGPLMESEMQRMQSAIESNSSPPGGGKTVTTKHAADGSISVSQMVVGQALDYLTYTVKLLAGLRWDSLEKLDALAEESTKRLAVYRGIRTQKFLEFTEGKIRERERSLQDLYETLVPTKKVITTQQQDGFFERLLDDATKRRARVEKLMNDKMAKEKEILTSSQMYTRRTTR